MVETIGLSGVERVYVVSTTLVCMGPCCVVDRSEPSAQRRRRIQGRTPECAPLACSKNINLCAGCRSSCWLQAHTQTRRIFSGSPLRATCGGFFEEVEHSCGAVQRNLQFPSGRHVVGKEGDCEGDFKIRQPERPPFCFHWCCGQGVQSLISKVRKKYIKAGCAERVHVAFGKVARNVTQAQLRSHFTNIQFVHLCRLTGGTDGRARTLHCLEKMIVGFVVKCATTERRGRSALRIHTRRGVVSGRWRPLSSSILVLRCGVQGMTSVQSCFLYVFSRGTGDTPRQAPALASCTPPPRTHAPHRCEDHFQPGRDGNGRERTVRSGNARPPPPARQHSLPRLNAMCTGRSVLWYKWRLPRGLAVGCFIVPRRAPLFELAVVVIVYRPHAQFQKNPSLLHILPKSAPQSCRSTELRSQH